MKKTWNIWLALALVVSLALSPLATAAYALDSTAPSVGQAIEEDKQSPDATPDSGNGTDENPGTGDPAQTPDGGNATDENPGTGDPAHPPDGGNATDENPGTGDPAETPDGGNATDENPGTGDPAQTPDGGNGTDENPGGEGDSDVSNAVPPIVEEPALAVCDGTAQCQATEHAPGCNANGECVITLSIGYYSPVSFNSGGSQYSYADSTLEETTTEPLVCKLGKEVTVALSLTQGSYVLHDSFEANTHGSLAQGIDGSALLTLAPTGNGSVALKAGLDFTGRVHLYNFVLKDGAYVSQFTQSDYASPAATVLLPKDAGVEGIRIPDSAKESAYTDFEPAISTDGEYAGYGYTGTYRVYYVNGADTTVVADPSQGVDLLSEYGLQIDAQTGAVTSLDGQNAPVLSGNEYFLVHYYFAKEGERELGSLWTYTFVEDHAGTYPHNGKKYRLLGDVDQGRHPVGDTVTVPARQNIPGYAFSDAALHEYTIAGWVACDEKYGFSVTADGAGVVIQPSLYLAVYAYYDTGAQVTVERSYHSGYSSTPNFSGSADYTDSSSVMVPLSSGTYPVSGASGRDGYTLVQEKTTVNGEAPLSVAEDGSVTVELSSGESGITVRYYYYHVKPDSRPDPDPDRPKPTPDPDPDPEPSKPTPPPEVDITDPEVPLGPAPEATDEAPAPVLPPVEDDMVVIDPGQVPLGDLPQTGSRTSRRNTISLIFLALAGVSAAATGILLSSKKSKE